MRNQGQVPTHTSSSRLHGHSSNESKANSDPFQPKKSVLNRALTVNQRKPGANQDASTPPSMRPRTSPHGGMGYKPPTPMGSSSKPTTPSRSATTAAPVRSQSARARSSSHPDLTQPSLSSVRLEALPPRKPPNGLLTAPGQQRQLVQQPQPRDVQQQQIHNQGTQSQQAQPDRPEQPAQQWVSPTPNIKSLEEGVDLCVARIMEQQGATVDAVIAIHRLNG